MAAEVGRLRQWQRRLPGSLAHKPIPSPRLVSIAQRTCRPESLAIAARTEQESLGGAQAAGASRDAVNDNRCSRNGSGVVKRPLCALQAQLSWRLMPRRLSRSDGSAALHSI